MSRGQIRQKQARFLCGSDGFVMICDGFLYKSRLRYSVILQVHVFSIDFNCSDRWSFLFATSYLQVQLCTVESLSSVKRSDFQRLEVHNWD